MVKKVFVLAKKSKKTTAKKVQTLAKKVRQLTPELKYSDLNVIGQTFNYTPTASYVQNVFTPLSQGDSDANNYTGDEIFVKNIKIRGVFYNTTTNYQVMRIVLVCVKQNMEGLITTANIGNLVMESAYSSTANAINAPLDNDNRHGVTVLYDKKIIMNPNLSSATTSSVARVWNHTFKINKMVQFQNGGNIPTKNGLYLFFIADNAVLGYLNYVSRLTYTDV